MSDWYSLYKNRLTINGDNYVDIKRQEIKDQFYNDIENSPSYYSVEIERNLTSFIKDSLIYDAQDKKKKIIACEDVLIGDIVTVKNKKWICTEDITMINELYRTCEMQKCNYTLKWKDSTNAIHSIPALNLNWTLYDDGLAEGKQITLESNKRKVQIPNNDETIVLYEQQRFIINDKVYEISSINNDTEVGLLNIIMTQAQEMVGKDDWVNGIAWNEENEVVLPYTINILNGRNITLGYSTNWQIQYEVKQGDTVVNKPVIFSSTNTSEITVNLAGLCTSKAGNGTAYVYVKLAENENISSYVAFTVTNITHDYTVKIQGEDDLYLTQTNEYKATVYDLGLATAREVVWSINYNGNSNDIVQLITTSNTNTIQLKANDLKKTGSIILTAKYSLDQTKLFSITINICEESYW